MALMADCIRAIANKEEDAKLAEKWLLNSPMAAVGFELLGVSEDYILPTIERIRNNGFHIHGRSVLRTKEEQEKVHENIITGRHNRKPETKPRKRWRKYVSTTQNEVF